MKTLFTKTQLENKVKNLNDEFQNALGNSEKNRIKGAIIYYTSKLVFLDDYPNLNTIEL